MVPFCSYKRIVHSSMLEFQNARLEYCPLETQSLRFSISQTKLEATVLKIVKYLFCQFFFFLSLCALHGK